MSRDGGIWRVRRTERPPERIAGCRDDLQAQYGIWAPRGCSDDESLPVEWMYQFFTVRWRRPSFTLSAVRGTWIARLAMSTPRFAAIIFALALTGTSDGLSQTAASRQPRVDSTAVRRIVIELPPTLQGSLDTLVVAAAQALRDRGHASSAATARPIIDLTSGIVGLLTVV